MAGDVWRYCRLRPSTCAWRPPTPLWRVCRRAQSLFDRHGRPQSAALAGFTCWPSDTGYLVSVLKLLTMVNSPPALSCPRSVWRSPETRVSLSGSLPIAEVICSPTWHLVASGITPQFSASCSVYGADLTSDVVPESVNRQSLCRN
jgi:hypothetical protein